MKAWLATFLFLAVTAVRADDSSLFDSELEEGSEGRLWYVNSSSTATALTLLGALILLGVIGYLIYAGGVGLSGSAYNRNDYAPYEYGQGYEQYAQYR